MVAPKPNRVLLDTHALMWYAENSPQLPETIKQLPASEQTTAYVSVVSFWELATLTSLGRLVLMPDLATWIAKIRASSFQIILIEDQHLVAYAALPQVKDHRAHSTACSSRRRSAKTSYLLAAMASLGPT